MTDQPYQPPHLSSEPAVPARVKGLGLVSLFNDFASEMIYPLLPAFVTVTLGGSATILGALDGAADLTAALVKWVSGRLADRRGWRKPLILVGYLTAVLIRPLMAISGAAWQVVGFRVIDRVGKGLRTPPRDSLIADITPVPSRGRAFGFHRAADHFGAVLGSLAAWWLLREQVQVRDVLAWSLAPGVVAFVVLALVLRGAREVRQPSGATTPGAMTAGLPRRFWVPVLLLAGFTFFRLPEMLLLLRLQDLGVTVVLIPLVWAGLHVVRTLASYPGGWLSDRLGPRRLVALGGALFALLAWGLGNVRTEHGGVLVFLSLGLVAGLTESAERSLVARLSPARMGRGFGAYHAVTGIAALPAAVIFGALYQKLGGPAALYASAGAMLMTVGGWVGVRSEK
ncbi:MAG: MFS transporter [Gemmatimonadales bacterium]